MASNTRKQINVPCDTHSLMKIGNKDLTETDLEYAVVEVGKALDGLRQSVCGNLNCPCTDEEFYTALGNIIGVIYERKRVSIIEATHDVDCACETELVETPVEVSTEADGPTDEEIKTAELEPVNEDTKEEESESKID